MGFVVKHYNHANINIKQDRQFANILNAKICKPKKGFEEVLMNVYYTIIVYALFLWLVSILQFYFTFDSMIYDFITLCSFVNLWILSRDHDLCSMHITLMFHYYWMFIFDTNFYCHNHVFLTHETYVYRSFNLHFTIVPSGLQLSIPYQQAKRPPPPIHLKYLKWNCIHKYHKNWKISCTKRASNFRSLPGAQWVVTPYSFCHIN